MMWYPAAWSKSLGLEVLEMHSSAHFAPAMSDGARTSEPWRITSWIFLVVQLTYIHHVGPVWFSRENLQWYVLVIDWGWLQNGLFFFQDAIDKTLSKAFLLQVVLLRSFLLPKSWRLEVPRTPPYPKRSWRGQLPDCLSLGYAVRWLHLMMAQFTTSSSTYKYWIVWQTFWCPKDVKVLMLRMAGQVQFLSNFGPPTIQGNGSLRAFHWLQCTQSLLNMGCSSKKGFTSNHVFFKQAAVITQNLWTAESEWLFDILGDIGQQRGTVITL